MGQDFAVALGFGIGLRITIVVIRAMLKWVMSLLDWRL